LTQISVWAPFPKLIELELDDGPLPLENGARGWRRATTELDPEMGYAFRLDGRDPLLPDPRSPWQPEGVHGRSRTLEHSRFAWTDAGWPGVDLRSAVIYELHVGTFSREGTFAGVAAHLDHLVELGVNVVELMPVAEFAGERGWGYDGVDLYAPHHSYGGPEELKRLVDACHARRLGVLLDVVYNHLGPEGNYLERFGPYFTDRYSTPWGKAVNFDGRGSDEVRSFFIDNALMWLRDYHFDGLRLDAVHAILDTSAVHFLEQLELRVESLATDLGRPLHLVAESAANDPRLVWDRDRGGYGLAATWSDDLHHALHSVLTGERTGYYSDYGSLQDVATALRLAYVYAGRYSGFRQKTYGRPAIGLDGERFLGYIQNHDQVGNRARGERIGQLVSPGRAKIAAALVLTSAFVPLVFMGEEWAASTPFPFFASHADRAVAEGATKGRRREFAAFGWKPEDVPDPMDPATFRSAKLRWEEVREGEHGGVYDFYRSLLRLRCEEPGLCAGDLATVRVDADDASGRLLTRRGRIAVACNLGRVSLDPGLEGELLLASEPAATARSLPPDAVVVVRG
jgi:maltooligosyltrehalose trehalohydrolase